MMTSGVTPLLAFEAEDQPMPQYAVGQCGDVVGDDVGSAR